MDSQQTYLLCAIVVIVIIYVWYTHRNKNKPVPEQYEQEQYEYYDEESNPDDAGVGEDYYDSDIEKRKEEQDRSKD